MVEFNIVPTQDELDQMERDLRFYPSPVDNPQLLSVEQTTRFNREGFVKGIRIFDSAEMAGIRNYFDKLLEQTLAAGGEERRHIECAVAVRGVD